MTIFNKYNNYSKYFLFVKKNSPYKKLLAFKRSKWKRLIKTFKFLSRRDKNFFYFKKKKKKSYYKYKYRTRFQKRIKVLRFKKFRKKKFNNKKLKRKSKVNKRLNYVFPNFRSRNLYSNRWNRFKKNYRTGLTLKQSLSIFYNNSVSFKFFKKQSKTKSTLITKYILKPIFTLEVFLWKLRLFDSTRLLKQYIFRKNILINGSPIKFNQALFGGDIIFLKNINFSRPLFKFLPVFFYSFCEFDFYTNTFLILREINRFSKKEFRFFIESTRAQLNLLEYYLTKK